jgi:hypothetical protein
MRSRESLDASITSLPLTLIHAIIHLSYKYYHRRFIMARRKPRKNAKSSLNKLSGFLLATNKIVRDINAVKKGTIADRVVRRTTGKVASKGLGSDFLKFFNKK